MFSDVRIGGSAARYVRADTWKVNLETAWGILAGQVQLYPCIQLDEQDFETESKIQIGRIKDLDKTEKQTEEAKGRRV